MGGAERGCRQKRATSILLFKLWLDKRETGPQRPIQKAQTEYRSQACVQSVVSHLSTLLEVNVSSPDLDPALHLALASQKCDFIHAQHQVQRAQASQAAAGLGPPSTQSQKIPGT